MATRKTTTILAASQTQRRTRRLLLGLFGFVVCVLAVDALVGDQGLLATIRARKQYNQLASDLGRLRLENSRLREEAHRLQQQDPAVIEEIARRELGLMSPGEKLFIIKDVTKPPNK